MFLETIKSDHGFVDFAFCVFTWGYGVRSLVGVYGAEMMRVGGVTLVASLSHHRGCSSALTIA